ncbi:MAG TPA: mannose-1-phosphate guanylyltransferase/mannose-6-phosphate isomerase [Rhizomicrobium sp.]|nr:mannose-1-phosphate guanylyltransferase/mannose-6-phosphate isomerase [Rhizomicrobium sp.]
MILCGGAGTRLWPLSRQLHPKQFLALGSPQSLLHDTLVRIARPGFSPPVVICAEDHKALTADQLARAHISHAELIVEPAGRNTAPAATIAALSIARANDDAIILLMPSDHVIGDRAAFENALKIARQAAVTGHLVTFGVVPSSPETGYGYIQRGAPCESIDGSFQIERFVEKPDRASAERYLESGAFFWNSGIFCFSAKTLLEEMAKFEPAILQACETALARATTSSGATMLDREAFEACPAQSIDYGIMERTSRAVVVPVDMGWSDVGSWDSLWHLGPRDDDGNRVQGDVVTSGVRNSYLSATRTLLAVGDIEDVVVVATDDAVLVTRRGSSQGVKALVEKLKQQGRPEIAALKLVVRPWGSFESLDSGPGFQVKRLTVNPGGKLSLQLHHHRSEHWVVVSGVAQVTCGDKEFTLRENESTYIPVETRHRLENRGSEPLHVIEVQSGSYLGEDDIVRFDDVYGRVT